MKLIVGLGNPGKQYENTRHNMGFRCLDALADVFRVDFDHEKFNGVFGISKNEALLDTTLFAKPMTFMNNSGEFVRPLMEYFGIDVEDLIVVYDDMAIKEGTIRLRKSGSSGGHNGIKSIISHLKTEDFSRIRIGIGEPEHSGIDYVLTKPKGESEELAQEAIDRAAKAAMDALTHGFDYAMNHYNLKA